MPIPSKSGAANAAHDRSSLALFPAARRAARTRHRRPCAGGCGHRHRNLMKYVLNDSLRLTIGITTQSGMTSVNLLLARRLT